MIIKYKDNNIKNILCEQYGLIDRNKKSIFRNLFIEEKYKILDNLIIEMFTNIGYEEDIVIEYKDEGEIIGQSTNPNRIFEFKLPKKNNYSSLTIKENNYEYCFQTNITKNENNNMLSVSINKNTTTLKDKSVRICSFKENLPKEYNISVEIENYRLDSCIRYINKTQEIEQQLNEYFFLNFDTNKSINQIFKDIVKITGINVKEINHFDILIRKPDEEYYIAINYGKLATFGEIKNGRGYDFREDKINYIDYYNDKDNNLNNYKIEIEDEVVKIRTKKQIYEIPLTVLKNPELFTNTINSEISRKTKEKILTNYNLK